MARKLPTNTEPEHEFALIVSGVPELSRKVEDALFEAGCDDATLSIRFGLLYLQFTRAAPSLQEAIVSAIRDVRRSGLAAQVLRVDDCDLASASDIARRIGRSRQLVHQYITGARGPGSFPPPECHLADRAPLWSWGAVSRWLVAADLLPKEAARNAEVIAAINSVLERDRPGPRFPALVEEVARELAPLKRKKAV
jgi:hypothetical protein